MTVFSVPKSTPTTLMVPVGRLFAFGETVWNQELWERTYGSECSSRVTSMVSSRVVMHGRMFVGCGRRFTFWSLVEYDGNFVKELVAAVTNEKF